MSFPWDCHVVDSSKPQTHTIIFLHGRGSTGQEVAEEIFESEIINDQFSPRIRPLNLKERFPTCRWIFPTAKKRYSTVFQEDMTEWFDIVSLTDPSSHEESQIPGLIEGVKTIEALIHDPEAPINTEQLVLGGISQGYALAIIAMISMDLKCAGFIGLSGWLPLSRQIGVAINNARSAGAQSPGLAATSVLNSLLGLETVEKRPIEIQDCDWVKTAVFMGHERHDPVVAYDLGEAAYEVLREASKQITLHQYDSGEHWISEKGEIEDIAKFIQCCIDSQHNKKIEHNI